jgi:hypothetical protein
MISPVYPQSRGGRSEGSDTTSTTELSTWGATQALGRVQARDQGTRQQIEDLRNEATRSRSGYSDLSDVLDDAESAVSSSVAPFASVTSTYFESRPFTRDGRPVTEEGELAEPQLNTSIRMSDNRRKERMEFAEYRAQFETPTPRERPEELRFILDPPPLPYRSPGPLYVPEGGHRRGLPDPNAYSDAEPLRRRSLVEDAIESDTTDEEPSEDDRRRSSGHGRSERRRRSRD